MVNMYIDLTHMKKQKSTSIYILWEAKSNAWKCKQEEE